MAQALKQLHQGYRFLNPQVGLGSRPNVYRRSLEARRTTDAYLAEVERKAAGVDEPVPQPLKWRTYKLAAMILAAVGFAVALAVL